MEYGGGGNIMHSVHKIVRDTSTAFSGYPFKNLHIYQLGNRSALCFESRMGCESWSGQNDEDDDEIL